jgi:hypothetical protein
MKCNLFLVAILLCFTTLVTAQQSPAVSSAAPAAALPDDDFVHKQFSDSCSLTPQWPPMTADLNGDGVEDIVIVARCKNPLMDQGENNYKVIDPLDSYYGYGDPKITTGLAPDDPKVRGIALLIIHGSGPDAWRSPTPQAKFVIINIAVKTIAVKKMKVTKKKTTTAIYIEEAGEDKMTSAIFWDGHKYRYEPLGSSME